MGLCHIINDLHLRACKRNITWSCYLAFKGDACCLGAQSCKSLGRNYTESL